MPPNLPIVLMLAGGCGSSESPGPATAPDQPPVDIVAAAQGFAGSRSCGECHPEQEARWEGSHHAHAWSAPEVGGPRDPALGEREIVGWVGWDPLRQPLIDVGDGRAQAWERAWDPAAREWFGVFADPREPGDRGHWTGPSMTWNSQCAPCHTTNLEIGYQPEGHRYETAVGEQGVGCEACHGPSRGHAEGQGSPPFPAPSTELCAPCHSRRADRDPAPEPTADYLGRYAPQLVDLGDAFWPDGQIRDEDFEYNAFLTSRMHQQGVGCTDCHDPHSGELVRTGDALCLECHATQEGFVAHDHHDGAVACVDCHMPQTTYMERHPRRDHGFRIPDPALAAELGAPDTCTRACHADRDPAWAAAALGSWGVDPDRRPQRARARAVAAARAGGPEGYRGALALLNSDPHPTWRAIGAGLLPPWEQVPEVGAALAKARRDPDPLVRFAASAEGDDRQRLRYLEAHRDQPDAAVEYGDLLDRAGDPRGLAELRRVVGLWPRESIAAHALAVALSRHGEGKEALAVLERAVVERPDDPGLWDALGRVRASELDRPGAIAALRQAVERDPTRARSWYNLGILLDSGATAPQALEAWTRASEADPTDPDPPWAIASQHLREGRTAEALEANAEALRRAPNHPGALALQRVLEAR